jgi:hypothetical protein
MRDHDCKAPAVNAAHIGGSARGYQRLSALLAISTTDEQQAAQAVCLCMANAGRECALAAARV